METKRCCKCKTDYPLSNFMNKNGKKEIKTCTKCMNAKEKYRKSEKGKQTLKKYRQTEKAKQCQKRRSNNPERRLYYYKNSDRNIDWYLSDEYAKELFKMPCHYCGYSSSTNLNGIDRKYNDIGYIPSNCVPCCCRCNFAKRTLAYEEFIDLCTRVAKNIAR